MVVSKFNFRFYLFIFIAFFAISVLSYFITTIPFASNPNTVFIIVPFYALVILFVLFLTSQFQTLKIDEISKTILSKKILTQQIQLYNFSDFDFYIDTQVKSKQGTFDIICLIKDKKIVLRIGGYYSNINELKNAISSIKYLGFQKDHSPKAINILSEEVSKADFLST